MGQQGATRVRCVGLRAQRPVGASRRRATALALGLGLAAAAAAGCDGALPGGASSTPAPSETAFGWFAYGDPNTAGGRELGTPVDAVERAGLQLPDHASVQRVATQSFIGFAESYLFVFKVDAATAASFCARNGLVGPQRVPADRNAVSVAMDDPPVTAGSRWCEGTSPTDPRWSRQVLIGAGNPATVHLSLQRSDPTPTTSSLGSAVTTQ